MLIKLGIRFWKGRFFRYMEYKEDNIHFEIKEAWKIVTNFIKYCVYFTASIIICFAIFHLYNEYLKRKTEKESQKQMQLLIKDLNNSINQGKNKEKKDLVDELKRNLY